MVVAERWAKLGVWLVGLLGLIGCSGLGQFGHRPAWELPTPPVLDAPLLEAGTLIRHTLPNGMRILLIEDHSLPKITIGAAMRRGIAVESPGKEGVAALCAEWMQRGSGSRDAMAQAQAVEELGASLVVVPGWDSIGMGTSGLSKDADRLFEILADTILRPRFDPEEFEKARTEQLADLASARDNPKTLLRRQLAKTLYPGHRYGIPGSGTPESVASLVPEDARTFYARVFAPGNAVFHVTGDFDAEVWLEKIAQAYGGWSDGPTPEPVAVPPAQFPSERRIVVVDRPDMVQVQIAVAHEGLARTDPRRIAASLLNNVLGGSGFSSRLMVRLRSEEGLTYGVRSGFSLRRRPGKFSVQTFTRADQARAALDLLLSEVRAIRGDRPLSETEILNAKAYGVGRFALGLETTSAVMGSFVDLDVHGLPEDSLDTYRARIRAVTRDELMILAEELLHPDRAAIVVVGPAEILVPALETLGPVEVVGESP